MIRVWGTRTLVVLLLAFGTQHWGTPLYKQYFAAEETEQFVPTTKVQRGKFTVSFHEMGTLEAERSVAVITEVGGKIIYLIGDGVIVQPGEKIAELDTTEIEREVYNETLGYKKELADVDRAKAEFEILKEQNKTELSQSQAELDFNKTELELATERLARKERLAADKLVTRSEVEQAKLEVRAKQLAVTKGEAALALKGKEVESKEQQKQSDMSNVEFRARMSQSKLKQVQNRMEKAVINAPAPGLVVTDTDWGPDGRRKLQEGDTLRPQQTICALPDLSNMLVKVKVGESDAPRVRLDMPVLIVLEAVPGKVFHGTVQTVSSLATEPLPWERTAGSGKSFEVTIVVKERDPKSLKPGMTADVEFISDSVADTVYVPLESVVEKRGKTYVFVKSGTGYPRVQVKTGKSNDNFTCITKGLKKGQTIALRDPTRPLEEQEAGAAKPKAAKTEKKKPAAPIPGKAGE
jgi:HlyD family secretion protein